MRHKYPRVEPEPVKSESEPHPYAATVAALGLLIFAAIFFPYIIGKYCLGEESFGWPVAKGKLVSFNTDKISGRAGVQYSIRASYEYAVEEKVYQGMRWSIGPQRIWESEFNFVSAKYHPGSPCDVHYQPADPSCAVLRPGGHMGMDAILLIGIATTAALSLMIAKARRFALADGTATIGAVVRRIESRAGWERVTIEAQVSEAGFRRAERQQEI